MQLRASVRRAVAALTLLFFTQTLGAAGIQDILDLPEDKIDIGIAALTIAKGFYPDLDISAYSRRIDLLVEKVRQATRGSESPDFRIRVLNTVLFLNEGFQYDHEAAAQRTSESYYLNYVLDKKKGNCVSLPILYMAIAQRLGYPVYSVNIPDHMILRYVDPAFNRQNIEVAGRGGYSPDEDYVREFRIGETGIKSGCYLRTETHREFLGHLMEIGGVHLVREKGNFAISTLYFEEAMRLNPRSAQAYHFLSLNYRIRSKHVIPELSTQYLHLAEYLEEKAKELGYVDGKDIPYTARMRRK